MTAAELVAWQRRNGIRTDAEAARVLGISPATYWRKRKGRTRITRQTEMLCGYYELTQTIDPLQLASINDVINKLIRLSISRR
jgi:hypothetical protein